MKYNKKKNRWEALEPVDFIGWKVSVVIQETEKEDGFMVEVVKNDTKERRVVFATQAAIPLASVERDWKDLG